MHLIKYGLTDLHSDIIYCHGDSVEELGEEFDLEKYRVTKLVFAEFEGYGHDLVEETIVHNPI